MKKIPTPVESTRNGGERGCRSNLATDANAGATAAGTIRAMMQRLIDQTSTPAPATAFGPQQNNGDKGKLIAKLFRCQQVTRKAEQWSDFQFRFKRAVRSQSDEAFKMLAETEVSEERFHMIGEGNGGLDDSLDERNPELSATIYDLQCQHVEGERLIVLKSNTDCNGFQSWMMLFSK